MSCYGDIILLYNYFEQLLATNQFLNDFSLCVRLIAKRNWQLRTIPVSDFILVVSARTGEVIKVK